jgi:hypothetical protein
MPGVYPRKLAEDDATARCGNGAEVDRPRRTLGAFAAVFPALAEGATAADATPIVVTNTVARIRDFRMMDHLFAVRGRPTDLRSPYRHVRGAG